MTCHQVERELAAYSAGMLSEQRSWQIEAHLAGCDACRAQLAQYITLDAAIRNDRLSPDTQRTKALLLQLEQERLWHRCSRRFLLQSLMHTSIFAVLALAVYIGLHSPAIANLRGILPGIHVSAPVLNPSTMPLLLFLGLISLALAIIAGMHALLERA